MSRERGEFFRFFCRLGALPAPSPSGPAALRALHLVHGLQNPGLYLLQAPGEGSPGGHGVAAAAQEAADLRGVHPAVGPGAQAQLPRAVRQLPANVWILFVIQT